MLTEQPSRKRTIVNISSDDESYSSSDGENSDSDESYTYKKLTALDQDIESNLPYTIIWILKFIRYDHVTTGNSSKRQGQI